MKRYITMLVVSAIAFLACDPKEEAPKPPVFNVTSEKTMNFEAEGGEGTITYTIENPSESLSVIAECDAEWVTDVTVGTDVTFTVVANESLEARSTEITVSYGESVQKVSVSQNGRVPNPILTLTSESTMSYTCEGGAGTITYTLEDPAPGVNVTAECSQAWITDITVGDEITFNVAANEESEAREATIAVAYGDLGFNVTVTQEGDPTIKMTLECLDVEYYGTDYSDYYNYYVVLSDKGLDEYGYALPDGTYVLIDIYSTTPADEESGVIRIPDGEYTFDAKSTYAAGTFSGYYSSLAFTDEDGYATSYNFAEGKATVTSEGIELVVTTEDGEKYRVTYEGEPAVYIDPVSNLEEDYSVNSDKGYFYAEGWGDYYEVGKQNYLVAVYTDAEAEERESFSIEILNDNPAGITGTYTAASVYDIYAGEVGNVFLTGELEDYDGTLFPIYSWLLSVTENTINGELMAPLVGGEMVITEDEGIHTFTFNGYDDAGNKISASIKGAADIYDPDGNLITANAPAATRSSIVKKGPKLSPDAVSKRLSIHKAISL